MSRAIESSCKSQPIVIINASMLCLSWLYCQNFQADGICQMTVTLESNDVKGIG